MVFLTAMNTARPLWRIRRMPSSVTATAISVFFAALCATTAGAQLSGRATVIDGDDIVLLAEGGRTTRIRLCGIDAPERECPGYNEATKELRALVEGKQVRCIQVGD